MTTNYLQFIDYGEKSAPLKAVSLHGFPSVRSKQNREIAQGIAEGLNSRVRVILYPGLSCPGVFSFTQTINALVAEFPSFIGSENKIDLLGHSFGGFSAILLAATYPQSIRKMVLLSPLLQFSTSTTEVAAFFRDILTAAPGSGINTLPPHDLAEEFFKLSQLYRVEELIAKLNPNLRLKLMQARADNVTPTAIAEEFRRHFKCKFDFELVEQDHSFLTDRPKLSIEIAEFLKGEV